MVNALYKCLVPPTERIIFIFKSHIDMFLSMSRYIGAKRAIAEFEKYQQKGPITKVIPLGAGSGTLIALLTDPNYKVY